MTEKQMTSAAMNELMQALMSLKSPSEMKRFLRDVATLSELTALSERLQVAKLVKKEVPYREIAKKTGASTATITRVAHWLHHGEGGYALVLDRMKK